MIKEYQKLVRSNIPKIISSNNEVPKYRIVKVDSAEAKEILLDKMIEEIEEVRAAKYSKELLEELADVYQVFRDIMKMFGTSLPELEKPRQEKELVVGPFIYNKEMIFLESVYIPEKEDKDAAV